LGSHGAMVEATEGGGGGGRCEVNGKRVRTPRHGGRVRGRGGGSRSDLRRVARRRSRLATGL
jgi:hypothetical protein